MRIKQVLVVLFIGMLFTACSSEDTSIGSSDASSDKVYELNLNVSAGPVSPFTKNVAEPWAEMVEKETNGAVRVNVFPSAALGTLPTAYQDIQGGLYEAGLVPPGRHVDTELFPLTIGDLPFLVDNPETAEIALTQFVDEFMQDVFEDASFMSISATDSFQVYSKKPIRTVEDLRNLKITDSSPEKMEMFKQMGAVPVSLDNTALYESVERGIIDVISYTAIGANGYKFEEVTSYMTKLDVGVASLMFMINTDFLDSLPEDVRDMFFEKFGPEYGRLITELYTQNAEESIAIFSENVKVDGGEVINPSEEELIAFRAYAKPIMDDWVQRANDRGYPGQEMMDYFVDLLKEQGVIIPE
jgi:TRAP-type C4-dicarboxylate transport system substrate-binding protein